MPRIPRVLAAAAALTAALALAGCVPSAPPAFSPEPTVEPEPTETLPTLQDFVDGFGDFEPMLISNAGPIRTDIPAGTEQALITASFTGEGDFVVRLLDADGEQAGNPLIEATGPYTGAVTMGLDAPTATTPTMIDIVGDGAYEISISPLSAAPLLALPVSAAGDAVFLVDGPFLTSTEDATEVVVEQPGETPLTVIQQLSDGERDQLVGEAGAFSTTVPLNGGPSLLEVRAIGAWSLTEG